MRHIRTLYIFLIFILLSSTPFLQAATAQRTALVIGNSNYSSGPLKNPVNDASDMAAALRKAGFTVVLKKDANLETMEESIEDFGNRLKRGGVGLFYYAGHGVQVNGVNYLIPIGAKVNKESDARFKAFDVGRILAEMENANNGLNIVLLDACRDNPFGKSSRSAARGLAILSNAPTGTFISYSTAPGQVAIDGEGRNSPYTRALLKYMQEPGTPITEVFIKVRQKLRKETGQVPWELSSIEGEFYFAPGKVGKSTEEIKEEAAAPSAELDDEQRKIDDEREKLRKEKELLEQKEALAKEKRELEEKKKKLATVTKPSPSIANEIKRDGRFIAYDNGTVLDTQTNLMWAAEDNGSNISWQGAKSYCENYCGAGYIDWRMPTLDELAGLFDASKGYRTSCGLDVHLTELIQLSCNFHWASERLGSDAANFNFWNGTSKWLSQYGVDAYIRVRPVRSAK
ncbi:MAG: caspase family protein [Syntrophales bacterium]